MVKCNCSLRIRLVGDGCSICNPSLFKEMKAEFRRELISEIYHHLRNVGSLR